jgi:DNA-binding NtrC family response regulator
LKNLVEIACYSRRRPIDLGAFLYLGDVSSPKAAAPEPSTDPQRPFKEAKNDVINEFEERYLRELLRRHEWNISQAARAAGIERAYLRRLIQKHNLQQ